MYLQLSFVSTGTSVESIQVTLGDKNSALVSCIIDKSSVDLVRSFFENSQRADSCQEPTKQLIIHETTFQVLDETRATNDQDHFVSSVQEGLVQYPPEICEEGVNGTYFLKNQQGNTIAVFKPQDEEGTSPTNPKYDAGDAPGDLTKGLLEGEGVLREVAAYMLDHSHFSGVPRTCLVDLDQFRPDDAPTRGSLQEFIANDGPSWDVGPAVFPTEEVHKIGILDLRIFNADRHGGNILLTKATDGSYRLTPIDHGFSLTDQLDKAWFDWMSFPQAKMPLSSKSLNYIAALDIEQDAHILTQLGIRKECIRTMKISTTLLKKGAARGLTLYQIGTIVTRMIYGQPSPLENMFSQALTNTNLNIDQLLDETNEKQFLQNLEQLIDQTLEAFNL